MTRDEPTCANCRYWQHVVDHPTGGSAGACRRRAPQADRSWPRTDGTDWCGEHEALPGVGKPPTALDKVLVFRLADGPIDLKPGETIQIGDYIVVDRSTGKIRKARDTDEGQRYIVPSGSRVTEDGYLEMPR